MAASFEYGDYNKFLVSVGLVVSGFSFAIPLLLIRNQSALTLSDKKYKDLTPLGRVGVHRQQEQITWLITWWPLISGITLTIGLILILFGLPNWKKRQALLDELDRAEAKKRRAEGDKTEEELKQLLRSAEGGHQESAREIERRSHEVLAEEIALDPDLLSALDSTQTGRAPRGDTFNVLRDRNKSIIGQFFQVEQAASEALKKVLDGDPQGKIFRDLRLEHCTIDLAIAPGGPIKRGIMLDVKLLPSGSYQKNYRNRFDEALSWAVRATNDIRQLVGVDFDPIFTFVAPKGSNETSMVEMERLATRLRNDMTTFSDQIKNLRFVITSENALLQASPELVRRVFLNGGPVELL